jgi:hypothetical protein
LCRKEFVEYALEVVEETVPWRLGPNMLEAAEKAEADEAVELCRYGKSPQLSVCVRRMP